MTEVTCLICDETTTNPVDEDWIPSFWAKHRSDDIEEGECEILCPACCAAYAHVDPDDGEVVLNVSLQELGICR